MPALLAALLASLTDHSHDTRLPQPFESLLGIALGVALVLGRDTIAGVFAHLFGHGPRSRRLGAWNFALCGVLCIVGAIVSAVQWLT
jgi:hypothetical protein